MVEENVKELETVSVKKESEGRTVTNESLAIIGAVTIVIVSVIALGADAVSIASAVGGGLVGYLVPYPRR